MAKDSVNIFYSANSAFVDEDYNVALSLYTKAIQQDDKQIEYYLKRSITYQKLEQHEEAIADASKAIQLTTNSNGINIPLIEKNESLEQIIAKCYLRKGISEFEIKQYDESKQDIEMASQYLPINDFLLKKWKKKIEDFSIQNPNLFSQTQTERQSTILSQSETNPQSTNTVQESNTMQNQTQNHQVAQPSLAQKVRHEWFQNENFVTISVFIKKVDPKNVTLEFEERSLSLSVKLSSGSEFCFDLDVLAHEIVPEESKYSVLSTKIEIKLKKKVVGIKWSVLEGEDDGIPDHINTLNQSDKPCYPSSSKKKFDWDSLEKSIEDEKPEGEAALNHLFQQIYRDADDNTRRAMMKSYVESNGTCLSTNWDEVKKSKVECKPPEGMIAKPYSE